MTAGQRIAYIRTSNGDGPDDLVQLAWANVDATYTEHVGPDDHRRPQRRAALARLKSGDTLVVQGLERIARDPEELRALLLDLNGRRVTVELVSEALTLEPTDPLIRSREVALLEAGQRFVRAGAAERQRVGINAARKKPRSYNGRGLKLSHTQLVALRSRLLRRARNPADSITKIAQDFGVSRETVYRYEKAGTQLLDAAKKSKTAKGQQYRGNTEQAARTAKDAIVKRRAAFAGSAGLSIEEARAAIPKPPDESDAS